MNGLDAEQCYKAIFKAYCVNQQNQSVELKNFCRGFAMVLGPILGIRQLGNTIQQQLNDASKALSGDATPTPPPTIAPNS